VVFVANHNCIIMAITKFNVCVQVYLSALLTID